MNEKMIGGIVFSIAGVVCIGFGLASCNGDRPGRVTGPTTVRLRLKWIHQGQFAGFYVADKLNFYKDEGLNVTISPGGQDLNAVLLVASGTDDIGIWGASASCRREPKGSRSMPSVSSTSRPPPAS